MLASLSLANQPDCIVEYDVGEVFISLTVTHAKQPALSMPTRFGELKNALLGADVFTNS